MDEIAARKYAVFLLSRMNYHTHVLAYKMEKRGASKEVISKVVEDCARMGLIDDEAAILREFRKGYGPKYIEHKFRIKGVRKTITYELQKEKILELSSKYKERQKAFRSLQRKGFDIEVLIEFFSIQR